MSYDNMSLGMIGASRFSGQRGRTADGTGRSGIRYPSPFFDIGHTYLPPSQKALLRWCRYYYLVNPLINATITKMAEYPVTEIIVDERDAKVKEKWEELLGQHLRYRAFQIECGLDYYTYGICFVTIHFPFTKYLICRNCNHEVKASKTMYRWRNLEYIMECEKCHAVAPAKVKDFYERDVRRIRLQRWNPEYVNVDPGFAGADPIYTFELPLQLRNDLILGKKNVLDTIPDVFVEAMRRSKYIAFSPENVFVIKRPIISQKDEGWGMPLIFPVLKDTFYLQILRKAQESIAAEHIVPLRILFPQAGSGTADPYTTINLDTWKTRIEMEIAKWKYDNNYIPILPLPVGNETIGGDGKALGLYQEMDVWSKQIVAGMGVPYEFVFGGLTYSGSNVSMRMVENMFIGYRTDHDNMLNQFVIRRIATFMGWKPIHAHMARFKMADDLQRMTYFFQLNQAQKISDQTLLQESDQDPVVELERKEKELERQMAYQRKMQLAQANTQAEVMAITNRAQAEAAMQMQAAGMALPGAGGAQSVDGAAPAAAGAGQAGQQAGQEGEMLDGQQVDPAMPAGSTVSAENMQGAPADGIPLEAQSPLTQGMKGGGANLLYLAKRAANQLEKMDMSTKSMELSRMKATNPQLFMLVQRIVLDQKGSQADPLNAAQSPPPQQRPTRRAAPVA
jgi:hypothetical protein